MLSEAASANGRRKYSKTVLFPTIISQLPDMPSFNMSAFGSLPDAKLLISLFSDCSNAAGESKEISAIYETFEALAAATSGAFSAEEAPATDKIVPLRLLFPSFRSAEITISAESPSLICFTSSSATAALKTGLLFSGITYPTISPGFRT